MPLDIEKEPFIGHPAGISQKDAPYKQLAHQHERQVAAFLRKLVGKPVRMSLLRSSPRYRAIIRRKRIALAAESGQIKACLRGSSRTLYAKP